MPITIHDVAKRLNLSITTVSRALDGYDDVAEETRKLVVATAQEMGYVPNRAARQLRRKRTDTIGYILPAGVPQFADPFFSEFIAGLGDEAALKKYDLLISTASPGTEAEKSLYMRWIQGHKVDGVVLNRIRLEDWRVSYLTEHGLPYVCLERPSDPVEYVGVEVDSRSGFNHVIAHLIELGHRRIAYIGTSSIYKIQADRFAGYREGLAAVGISFDPVLIGEGDLTPSGGYQAAQRLLDLPERPTAITCINDLTAIGVLHAAHERGLEVGQDLAVTGFDGIADAAHTQPPLTTLNQPVYDVARQLASMLLTQINGQPLPHRQVIIQPELLIRQSTTGER
ncbi:MAG TPA: LacI family DNA-binding transcriptional regulator [Anaerolineales bacterium]|nr:LacI family DNA-binding transcriptional regulator [Anaerolineales bacterium]